MPRGPRVDPEIKRLVARFISEGEHSPAAISRAIRRELAAYGDKRPYLPTERTIARLTREIERQLEPDDTRPWTLGTAEPEEAAVIMPVLAAVLSHRRTGQRSWISVGLARWIVKVAAAAPTLPPYEQYIVAREYWAAERSATGSPTRPYLTDPQSLDALLALRPWESEAAAEQYEQLLEQGIVGQPVYLGRWWRSTGRKGKDHEQQHQQEAP